MGTWKIKKTGKWVFEFQHQNQRHKKEGFSNRSAAIRAEAKLRAEVEAPQIQTPLISFQEIATKYLKYCQVYMQKNTWRQKTFVYRKFIELIGNKPAELVTKQDIDKHLMVRNQADGPKAANRDLRDIKALFGWAIDEEIIDIRNPCRRVQRLPEDPYVPYVPPIEDVAAVKLVANRDELDFIEVLYHGIARLSEAARLTWKDVNFQSRQIALWTRKRKGGQIESQDKPMNATLFQILHRRWKHRNRHDDRVFQFTDKQLRNMMHDLCEKARVKTFGFHAIRHHVLSVINDSDKASLKQIQELAGHKRQSTTETYLHSISRATREAVEILDAQNG